MSAAGPGAHPRISIALVTRNRPQSLGDCLASFRAQSLQPFEIVVSDDSDEEHAVQAFGVAREFDCIYTRGPRRGLYANRNHAALASHGSHILTSDDDHTHPKDYLESVMDAIMRDRSRVWIFGERHPLRPEAPILCPAELSVIGQFVAPRNPLDCAAIADGSTSYPREVFVRNLRYDENYRFGPVYYILGRELTRSGFKISFCDSTFVWHHHLPSIERLNLQAQIECYIYVLWVNALKLSRNPLSLAYAIRQTTRVLINGLSVAGGDQSDDKGTVTKLGMTSVRRAITRVVETSGLPSRSRRV